VDDEIREIVPKRLQMFGRWRELRRVDVTVQRVHRYERVQVLCFLADAQVFLIDFPGLVQMLGDLEELVRKLIVGMDGREFRLRDVIVDRQFKQYPEQDRDRVWVISLNCSSSQIARWRCRRPVQTTPNSR
jgi:hypothetical protein